MGYDIHITRKQNWFDDEGPEISLAELKDYADTGILGKMATIVECLSAKLQGDEGELYNAHRQTVAQPSLEPSSQQGDKPWWKLS